MRVLRFGEVRYFLPFFALAVLAWAAGQRTALDDYVQAPDHHYHYELAEKVVQKGYTAYLIHMTSQQWRGPNDVNRPIWRHWVTIYKPDAVNRSTGLLFITGGSDDERPKLDSMLASIATTTNSVVTELSDIPNQPLTFAGDPFGPRKEDEIIAFTWRRFIDTGDNTWPLRLPMTKAAVRAMDTVTSFLGTLQPSPIRVDHFVVAGESKRGWTTWTTAAVDPRVVAITPIVIDVLNVSRSFQHHYRCYGFWASAVKDYFDMKLMDDMDTKRYRELMAISDPYSYRDRYTMPKLLINSAGDQFFLPDSSRFYFDKLPGEKYLRYEPNSDHSLKGTDLKETFTAFYESVLNGRKRPSFQWSFEHDNAIRVTTKETPEAVKLWQATNPEHRDFRLESVGPIYRGSVLEPVNPGVYVARIAKPERGWTAFFVELIFRSGGKYSYRFTTAVRVVPDTEPYPSPKPGETRMGGE